MRVYQEKINASKEYTEAAADWGKDFKGGLVFEITDIPLEETKLKDLPKGLMEGVPGNIIEGLGETTIDEATEAITEDAMEFLPDQTAELLGKMDELNVKETKTVYAFMDLKEGKCVEAKTIKRPDEVDYGFVLSGAYPSWKKLVGGEASPTRLVMSGEMKVDGDLATLMKYMKAHNAMFNLAGEVETEFAF